MKDRKQTSGKRKFCIFLIVIFGIILFSGNIPGECFDCLEKGQPYGPRTTCVENLDDCDLSSQYALNFYYTWQSGCHCEKDEYDIPRDVEENVCKFDEEEIRSRYIVKGEQRNMGICPPCTGIQVPVYNIRITTKSTGGFYIRYCDIPFDISRTDTYYGCISSKCYQCSPVSLGLGEGKQWSGYLVMLDIVVNPDGTQITRQFGPACNPEKKCPIHPECPGDTNGDGYRDISDIIKVINKHESKNCNAENGCCSGADLNGDTVVDVSDFLMIVDNYKEPCPDK